jgi:hypothetical protein
VEEAGPECPVTLQDFPFHLTTKAKIPNLS